MSFFVILMLLISHAKAQSVDSNNTSYDKIGELSVSDLILNPMYVYEERGSRSPDQQPTYLAGPNTTSGVRPGYSLVGATWRRDRFLSATVKIGSKTLIGAPARYGLPPNNDEAGIIEAYGQLDSDYGRLRFGEVPIPFGLEGGDSEGRLRFPRSLLFQYRLVNIRDYGVSYRITYQGFFSEWAVHNGEGGSDSDGEAWLTMRWGWQGFKFLRVGISGTTGHTDPRSTHPAGSVNTSDLAGLNIDDASRIRIINGFVSWDTAPLRFALEASAGDTRQGDGESKMRALHADLELESGENFSWLLRYDTINPHSDLPIETVTDISAGVAWRSHYENSVLTLLATKSFHDDPTSGHHRAMLAWRLTPSILGLHAFL